MQLISIRNHILNHSCFQNAPSKHPIIILKDTLREEAQAMLEFAYTGEVKLDEKAFLTLQCSVRREPFLLRTLFPSRLSGPRLFNHHDWLLASAESRVIKIFLDIAAPLYISRHGAGQSLPTSCHGRPIPGHLLI